MRPITIALAASLAMPALAGAADYNPNLRVCVQFVEVPHPVLTELLAGPDTAGPVLHDKALALAKDGTVKLLETCVVMCRSGQKATVESICEIMFPTEYEPPRIPGQLPPPPPPRKPSVRPNLFDAFETRNTGTTLEVEPTLSEDGKIIDLRLVPEIVQLIRVDTFMEHVDKWGDASSRMPVFATWRLNTGVTLMAGQFEMIGVITPKPNAPVPAVLRKLLVFVRVDVLPVSSQP
jgi:hypothetical protein